MWNEDRDHAIITRWQKGETADKIAKDLAFATRSAVLGRIHRLRKKGVALEERLTFKTKAMLRNIKARSLPRAPRAPRRMISRLHQLDTQPPTPIIEDTSETQARRLLDLELYECRWPIGDPRTPEFGFCGCKADQPYGYCEKHQAKAFVRVA